MSMLPFGNWTRHLKVYVLLLILSVGCGTIRAAENQTSVGGLSDEAIASSPLNGAVRLEEVRTLHAQVQSDANLDPAVKQTVTQLLHQATLELSKGADLSAKAAEFDRAVQQTPAMLESINAELATSLVTPKLDIAPAATLAQVEQSLTQAEADLSAAQKKVDELEEEAKGRTDRRAALPKQIADANERLKEVQEQLSPAAEVGDEPVALVQARRFNLLTSRQAIDSELRAYEKEILSYDARRELLAARRDRAARRLAASENMAKAWRIEVAERRRHESEQAARKAREAGLAAARLHPEIRKIAEYNTVLAELRAGEDGLTQRIEKTAKSLQSARETIASVKERRAQLQQRIDAAGLTDAVALLLRRERRLLPDIRQYGPRMRQRKRDITSVQLHLIDLDDQRSELFDVAARVEKLAGKIADEHRSREDVVPVLTELLTSQRSLLDSLLAEHNNYFNTLVDLDAAEIVVTTEVESLADLIAEHILWVRSDTAIGPTAVRRIWEGLRWAIGADKWGELFRALLTDARSRPLLWLLLIALEVLNIVFRRRSRTRLESIAPMVAKIRTDRFLFTLEALGHAVLRSLSGVVALAFVAWRLSRADASPDFSKAVGVAFQVLAVAAFVVGFLRAVCASSGLAEIHFRWERETLIQIRSSLMRTSLVLLPFLWLGALCQWYDEDEALLELGRCCWVVFLSAFGIFVYMTMRPHGLVQMELSKQDSDQWLVRFKRPVFAVCFSGPLALAVASLAGYHYTAVQLTKWLAQSALLVVSVLLAQAFLLRFIQIIVRRQEFEQRVRDRQENRRRREALQKDGEDPVEPTPEVTDGEISVAVISEQTRKLIRAGMAFLLLFGLWLIWSDVLPALGLLDTVVLWTGEGKAVTTGPDGVSVVSVASVAVTLADLLLAMVVGAMATISARYLPGLLELAVLRQLPLGHGERYALMTIVRYIITAIGVVIVFNIMGIGWPKLQWLIAALSVGLGFGLQEIFANFVSGLILLFERPIRVGDYVTVGGTSGEVTRIQIRATTITDWDRKELIIPNKQFVTGELVNWTLSDMILRVVVPVGIAYGSDTAKAKETLLEVARRHPMVLKNPAPTALFLEFGESSLTFELRVFIAAAEHFMTVKDELHMAVDAAFRKAGIEIAFPQQDLHVRSVRATFPVTTTSDA